MEHSRHFTTTVNDATIRYRVWGPDWGPSVLLVHGSAANTYWWDLIADRLGHSHRVVAIDLSGHGDSDHRSDYSYTEWASEVIAVARRELAPGSVLVGHSMGGRVALQAAADLSDLIVGLTLLDTKLTPIVSATARDRYSEWSRSAHRVYATAEQAAAAFRPIGPDSVRAQPDVLLLVGQKSVRAVDPTDDSKGWVWKFDRKIFGAPEAPDSPLAPVPCQTVHLRAEHGSICDRGTRELFDELCRVDLVSKVLPGSGHHMLLDAPDAVHNELSAIVAAWMPADGTA